MSLRYHGAEVAVDHVGIAGEFTDAVRDIHDTISQVAARLSPVLRPTDPQPSSDLAMMKEPLMLSAHRLTLEELHHARARLFDLLDRLEV